MNYNMNAPTMHCECYLQRKMLTLAHTAHSSALLYNHTQLRDIVEHSFAAVAGI